MKKNVCEWRNARADHDGGQREAWGVRDKPWQWSVTTIFFNWPTTQPHNHIGSSTSFIQPHLIIHIREGLKEKIFPPKLGGIFFCDQLHCIECRRGYVRASGKVAEGGGDVHSRWNRNSTPGQSPPQEVGCERPGQQPPIPPVLTSVSSTTVPMTTRSNDISEYLST